MRADFEEKENNLRLEYEAKIGEIREQHAVCLKHMEAKEAEVAEIHAAKVTAFETQIIELTRRVSRHEQLKRELDESKRQAEVDAQ